MGAKKDIEEVNKRIPAGSFLKAIEYVDIHSSNTGLVRSRVRCRCVCGKEKICITTDLIRGNPLSCGCSSKAGRKKKQTIKNQ